MKRIKPLKVKRRLCSHEEGELSLCNQTDLFCRPQNKIFHNDGCWRILPRVKEEKNIVQAIKIRKAKWIVHILRRNRLVKHVTEM
jgi:hypothetical protein